MANINASELRAGIVFIEDGNLWQVITYEHIKMGRGSGTIKVKAKNLRSGAITEKAFITGARVYLYEGLEVPLIVAGEEALAIELPNSLVYEISETGPEEKGNTVSNVYKEATLSNGLVVKVPMFMHEGEKVKIDTRTGEYVERVK
ncbi:hypothetical protein HYW44_00985 [Candidatus Daviesbacteria bacterium]|nr:hypothetical protein [Candidatus Daviesbacteria bacterium]